jgi:hypothetical protein
MTVQLLDVKRNLMKNFPTLQVFINMNYASWNGPEQKLKTEYAMWKKECAAAIAGDG